ncbi:MAG: 2-succinylbenzoate--CoA ligase [Synechococcales cyanobacterium C42_A2020_086]|nr:2-succinylbenzoate--CoA ligase [Synechococcales cyanobacterium C42_A2020_086]
MGLLDVERNSRLNLGPDAVLAELQQRASISWLIGLDSQQVIVRALQYAQSLGHANLPTVLLAAADPAEFLAGLVAAVSARCPLVLGNPHWAAAEWQQVVRLVQPHQIWGDPDLLGTVSASSCAAPVLQPGWILIPTGGSSGQIRFAIHTWETLAAAVAGFRQFFQLESIHSCCVLPLYHVSGLMQFVRSFISGGQFALLPFKALETNLAAYRDQFDPGPFFLSLVPTQLQRLLLIPDAVPWLAAFQTVLLGGAPAWTSLLQQARHHHLRLAPTYGMTETAAQIATLPPETFLQGTSSGYRILPHATVEIWDSQGRLVPAGVMGTIAIRATSLMLGYRAAEPSAGGLSNMAAFATDDLGFLDGEGGLHIVGRHSQKIITGGENVFPSEVEAAIRSTGLVTDVCVVGMPDQTWGEVVTAVYVPASPAVDASALKAALAPRLSKFKHPKQWIAMAALPRTPQGKIAIELLKRQVLQSAPTLLRLHSHAAPTTHDAPETPPN